MDARHRWRRQRDTVLRHFCEMDARHRWRQQRDTVLRHFCEMDARHRWRRQRDTVLRHFVRWTRVTDGVGSVTQCCVIL
ncbi:hypothetical protein ACOMHN_018039 [Nucella lapillus]